MKRDFGNITPATSPNYCLLDTFGLTADFDPDTTIEALAADVEDWMERQLTADELNQLAGLRLDRIRETVPPAPRFDGTAPDWEAGYLGLAYQMGGYVV